MQFRTTTELLSLGRERLGFTQHYVYEWDDGLGEHNGKVFMNFQITNEQIPAEQLGESIFETFKSYFFLDLGRDPYDRFEDALKEVNALVAKMEEEQGMKFFANVHVVIGALVNAELLLSSSGYAEAYLVRKMHLSPISEGFVDPKKEQQELFANIASGILEEGDFLFFATARLLRYITKVDLGKMCKRDASLESIFEKLESAVRRDVSERMTVLGIKAEGVVESHTTELTTETVLEEKRSAEKGFLPVLQDFFQKCTQSKVLKKTMGRFQTLHERSTKPFFTRVVGLFFKKQEEKTEDLFFEEKEVPARSRFFNFHHFGRDKILILLVIVIISLFAGIFWVHSNSAREKLQSEFEAQLVLAEDYIAQATTKGAYDKETAVKLLTDAETLALEVLNSGYLRSKASLTLTKVEQTKDRLDGIIRITDPQVLVDLTTKRSTVNALGVVPMKGHLFAYEYNALYEIILDTIQDPLTIDDTEVVTNADYFEDQESIVFVTKSHNVIEYEDGQFSFLDNPDGVFHTADDLTAYNDKVYLLDAASNQIWKYKRLRDAYAAPEAYNIDGDLSKAVSIAIDSSVYALTSDGEIKKFYGGLVQSLTINRAPIDGFAGATRIYTAYELPQVFVLDPTKNRVLVFLKDAKTGDLTYTSQYVVDNGDTLRDLYYSQEDGKLYVMGQSKVYILNF